MKAIWKSLFLLTLGAFALSSCEDVPEPYPTPGLEDNGSNTPSEPAGDGTVSNPFNVAAVNEFIEKGEGLDKTIYIKGIISSVKEINTSFGNGTFYISDNGSTKNQFYVYRCFSLDNKKFTSEEEIKTGDEVIICGKVTNYNGTFETVQNQAYVYSINGQGGTPSEPITGANLLTNGDLESWADGLPTNWKSACTASSAQLSQSTDAHGGSYSVQVEGNETQNKRIAYKELTLKPGAYEFSFYAKSTTDQAAQCRPGYVPVNNGSTGDYNYGGYASINNTSWTKVSHTFTLDVQTTVCLVVMSPKTTEYATAQNILIDDAELRTNGGGIVEDGGNTPETPGTDAEHITIADFLSKANTETNYELTGVVKNIKNTLYGNFDLVEGNASIYIYGLLDLNGAPQKFESLGIAEGDEITVVGKYGTYNGSPQIKNAQFVKINKKGEGGGEEPGEPETPEVPEGSNMLENGDFESWNGNQPANWTTTSSAGNATLSQSTESHGGSYSVSVGYDAKYNKRLGYKEMTLSAGTYVFSYYAKATTANPSQCQPGYVPIKDDGTADSNNYKYLGYVTINNTSWTLISKEFTLNAETKISLVIMNPKTTNYATAQEILIDDASLIKK